MADRKGLFRALNELDRNGLTEELSPMCRRITKRGRAIARALRERGEKGYDEVRGGIIGRKANPREGS